MKEVPSGWASFFLGEITSINPKLPFSEIDDETEVSFLPMKCVEEVSNKINLSESKKYSEVKKGFTPMTDGDVIFAKITPCMENGKIAVVHSLKNHIAFGSTEFHVFRCKEAIFNHYLFYYLVSAQFRQDAQYHMTGAVGQKRVPKKYLEDYCISLPPLPEQHRIVAKIEELFSSLEKGIESLKAAQAQLKIYRQAVLKWAFEGKLTNDDVKEGELPKGWKWENLSNLMESIKNGYSKKPDENGEYKILRISAVRPTAIDITDVRQLKNDIGADKSVVENDLLFTRYNGSIDFVGVSARVPRISEKLFYPDKLIRCRPILKYIYHSKYIEYATNSIISRQYVLSRMKTTAGQTGISGHDIKGIPIPLALLPEQSRIVAEIESRLSVCDKLEESITQSLLQSETLRQSILKKAFEGKLVPQDPNDEPASVLLDRIKAERAAVVAKNATTRAGGVQGRKRT